MTSATSDVKAAVENLEEKSGMNFLLIGGIAAGVIVVVVVIIIIVVSSNSKKKKKAQAGNGNVPPSGMPQQPNGAVVPPHRAPEQPKAPYAQPYQAEPDGAGETTLLDSGAGETTLLNGAGSAYLIRKKNGEKITINSQNFAIGKERRRVNYCISDNTSVSRYHVVITKKGSDYYAADQKSSNFTFVNGVQLNPYQETLLTDRSTLKISDEEFEFHAS